MTLKDYETQKGYKIGTPLQNVPLPLKSILPHIHFLQPSQKPGIYGLYFPTINKIYIGESVSITREISMYRTGQRQQILINKLFQENKSNVFAFSIFQGEALSDKNIRKDLESLLIQKTVDYNINVQKTTRLTPQLSSHLSNTLFLTTKIIDGPLNQYGLDLVGHQPPTNEGCIYMFINPVTKNFYIGETRNFYTTFVMKRHRATIYGYYKRKADNISIPCDKTTEKVANDLNNKENVLLFTALKNLDNVPKQERLKQESFFKKIYLQKYKDRLYNQQNFIPIQNRLVHSHESIDLIRQGASNRPVIQDLTAYPCICEGKWYESRADASRAYGYKSPDGLKYKLNNPQEVNFIWLKKPLNKPIPNDPIIQEKINHFFNYVIIKPKRIIYPKQDTD